MLQHWLDGCAFGFGIFCSAAAFGWLMSLGKPKQDPALHELKRRNDLTEQQNQTLTWIADSLQDLVNKP